MDGIWASDGSDYDISLNSCSVSEEDSEDDIGSINSTNYHNEIDGVFPPERILQHCDIEYVPPKGTDGSKISEERLRELIEQHRQRRTVKKFLCDIDTESNFFDARYTDIDTSKVDINLCNLPNNEKPKVKSYLISKTYCTMLGYACLDPDGPRGEKKIRLILDTAKQYHINMRLFLATFSKRIFKTDEHTQTWIETTREKDNWRTTPLLVISNDHSTPESIRMIACAWPQAVFIRGDVEDETKTLLMDVVYSCSYDLSGECRIERLKNITDALFEAAEKTKEGARGLVMMSDSTNKGLVNYFDAYQENESEQTVLHIATSYYAKPEEVLPIFLKVWPDAMLKLGEHQENCGDYPFHNVFRFAKTYESVVKCIEVFLRYSTLPAFASCLLYENSKDGVYAFDLFLQALQSPEITKIKPRYKAMECETIWQERLKAEVYTFLKKKDLHGRTFLHHIVGYNREDDDLDEGHRRGMIMREDLRHLINRYINLDDDNDIDDELGNEMLQVWEKHQQEKMEKVGEIAQWILNQDNEQVHCVDNNGLNPLQYAVSIGKKWSEGLDILVKIVPEWSQPPKNNTLCPFAMSGYASNDLDTTFQLLRHDATVIHHMTTL